MSQLACKVRIVISEVSRPHAKAVSRALEPDNTDFPQGLSLEIEEQTDDMLVIICNSDGTGRMGHLIGTVDEVLGHVQASLGAIRK